LHHEKICSIIQRFGKISPVSLIYQENDKTRIDSEVQTEPSGRFLLEFGKKYRKRRFVVMGFSRTMIELIHHLFKLVIAHILRTATFCKVLP